MVISTPHGASCIRGHLTEGSHPFSLADVCAFWFTEGGLHLRTTILRVLVVATGFAPGRLLYGHVIDFLQFHWGGWAFPSFNVADSAITLGAVLLIVDELRRVRGAR